MLDHGQVLSLVEALKACSSVWAEQPDNSLAKLGRAVVNDGGFCTRLDTQTKGTTTETLERFARFLSEAANWPEGAVPAPVQIFAARVFGAMEHSRPTAPLLEGSEVPA